MEQPPVAPAPAPPAQPEEPDPAAITLRLPEGEQVRLGETLAMGAEPGGRARVLALVRNQSGIVDNYELSVRGLPDDWWSVFPNTVYLTPFGTSGTYEQEVEIHLHPPRTPEAEARIWELQVVAESKAYNKQAAAAPLRLGIQPFEELKTKLEPERASGRRKASYEVAIKNTANAPVTVALDHEDPDNALKVSFDPPTLEVPAGQTQTSQMVVRPPRQKWIGRPEEKRLSVHTRTGEEALAVKEAAEAPAEPEQELAGLDDEESESTAQKAGGLFKKFGGVGPSANVGARGVQVAGPRAPRAPSIPNKNIELSQLKVPGGGTPAPNIPLQPNQVVFRQKAWLPWWIMMLLPLLILLAAAAVPVPPAQRHRPRGHRLQVDVRRRDRSSSRPTSSSPPLRRRRSAPRRRPAPSSGRRRRPARRRRRTPRSRSRSRSATARSRSRAWSARPRPRPRRRCARRSSRSASCSRSRPIRRRRSRARSRPPTRS